MFDQIADQSLVEAGNFIDFLFFCVDDAVTRFVELIYMALVSENRKLIVTIIAISLATYGWLVWNGAVKPTVIEFFRKVLGIGFIGVLIYNFDAFHSTFYRFFMYVPDHISQTIIEAIGKSGIVPDGEKGSGSTALAVFFDRISRLTMLFFQGGILEKIGACLVGIGGLILMVENVGMLVMTRVFTGVLLAEAPIFLVFYLFNGTRGLFEGWLRQLFGMFLAQILAYGVMTVIIVVMARPVAQLESGDVDINYSAIMTFSVMIWAMVWTMRQMESTGKAIAGGFVSQQYNAWRDGLRGNAIQGAKWANKQYRNYRGQPAANG